MLVRLLLLLCLYGSVANKPENASAAMAAAEEEEDEDDRNLNDSTDLGIAIMLLGSVSFMMCVFYLVNHSDDAIKRYTWNVISSTCSIFVSVLVFQACNKNIENFVLDGASHSTKLVVEFSQLAFWLTAMQFVLYGLSKKSKAVSELRKNSTEEVDKESLEINFEENVKSFGILLAHISGFASINAWGTMQQSVVHHIGLTEVWHQQLGASCVVALSGCIMGLILITTSRARRNIYLRDGEIDEIEELENDLAKETEDDVVGMTISFSLVQVIRFVFTGDFPDVEGNSVPKSPGEEHCFRRVLYLLGSSLFFAVLVMRRPGKMVFGSHHNRIQAVAKIAWSTSFAWSLYFATFWYVRFMFGGYAKTMHATLTVILALVSTAVAFFFIFGLERLEGSGVSGNVHKGVKALILSLAILVGFSWERGFDIALDIVAERLSDVFLNDSFCGTGLVVLLLAAVLSAVVLPAWMWFILPHELQLERDCVEKKTREEQERKDAANPLAAFVSTDGDYMRLPDSPPPTPGGRGQSAATRSPRSTSPRVPVVASPNDMSAVSQRVGDLKAKVIRLHEMRNTNFPREHAPQAAVRCSEIMASLEAEAASLNLQLMESKVAIDRQAMEQATLAEDVLRVRMELHNTYKEFWGAPAG